MTVMSLIKKSFLTVVTNPVITLFLVLYLILTSVLSVYIQSSQSQIIGLILIFCEFSLTLCFVSGWLQIVKENIKEEKGNKPFSIFLEGVGKNIIPITIGAFIYAIFFVGVLFLTTIFADKFIGSLDFIIKDLPVITQNPNAFTQYFMNLTDNQKYILYAWQFTIIIVSMVYNFLFLFYLPAIIASKTDNVFLKSIIAIKESFVFTFKKFFRALGIYFLIYSFYAILSILKVIAMQFPFASILVLFIYIYFVSISVMLIFNCYEQKDNSDNGCDCIGQDESHDKISEEN